MIQSNILCERNRSEMEEQIILVTGGDGKIAREIVKRYLNNNCKVIAIDRKENTDEKDFLENTNYEYYQADITDINQIIKIKEKIEKKYKKITHLISAAGGPMQDEVEGLENVTIENIDKSIKLNLNSHIYITKTFLPLLEKELSTNKSIVIVSSVNAIKCFNLPIYSAAKAGILGFVKVMTKELGKKQIRINSILPGTTVTQEEVEMGEKFVNYSYKPMMPFGEFTRTTDIADAIFALTNITKAVTGQNLIVDYGQTA